MFRHLLPVGLLLVFLTACSPATSDVAAPQTEDSAEMSDMAQEVEDDHSDEEADEHSHEEGEAHEEGDGHEGEEHAHEEGEAHEDGDHSDEDAEDHAHEEGDGHEGEDHAHEEGEHSDEKSDSHSHEDHDHGDENERREHGAHEHGAAQLMIAWSGNDMAIDLETPSFNVLGFEYAPTSDEEKNLLTESVTVLEEGSLFQFNADAECAVVSANVESTLMEDESHAEEHEGDEEDTHSDIDVSYNLECLQPDNIASLDASQFFAQFPNFEAIQVQWVSDTQQSAGDLTPDNSVLSLK